MAEEPRRRNLGRGLDALLGAARPVPAASSASAAPENEPERGRGVSTIAIDQIYPGRAQPRMRFAETEIDELAESIRSLGILQPLIVRPHPDRQGSYEIIAGERRWRAAQQARLHEVPALVRDLTDGEALEVALVENLQRENLSAIEEAEGYRRLMEEFAHTQEALGQMLGKSRSHVANTLRLLQLPGSVKAMVSEGQLSAGHARALLNATDPEALARQIVRQGLNVRQAERKARGAKPAAHRPRAPVAKDSNTVALEYEVSAILGLDVSIDFDDPGGRVVVTYRTLEQLDYVVHRLTDGAHGRPHPGPRRHPHPDRAPASSNSSQETTVPNVPTQVEDAIRTMEEGVAWDEGDDFDFASEDELIGGDLDSDLDKLISDTPFNGGDPFADPDKSK